MSVRTRGIDVEKLKQQLAPHALRILEARGMEVVGSRTAAEVQIRNRSNKRAGGKGRGDEKPSASWNAEKGLFVDFVDATFSGDLIAVVAHCDGLSFVDAARRLADEAGVELPTRHWSGTSSASPDREADGQVSSDRPNPTPHPDVERDKKIRAARRKWENAGPLRDSCSESYLAVRGIALSHEEPWLRSNDAAQYWAPPTSKGEKPTIIATMPALVAALTIAGAGAPQAVVQIFFGHSDDGDVTLKPRIVDPRTGRELSNKLVRGSKAGAGVFVGLHHLNDTIVIAEAVEDALSAVEAGYAAVAKLSANGLDDLVLPPEVKCVVLAADNDAAGSKGIAKAVPAFASRGLHVLVAQMPTGIKDLNELLMARGVESVRRVLDAATPGRQAEDRSAANHAADGSAAHGANRASRLVERADDVVIGPGTSEYLIKGLLDRRAVALLYGASAVGKSFVALRLASHVATGTSFGRHRVRKAPVLYAALEGEAGFRKRLAALKRQVGDHGDFLYRLCSQPVLNSGSNGDLGEEQILAAARDIQALSGEPVGMVIIDTLWRAMSGDDENDAAAFSRLMARIARIQADTGAAVVLVHHTGKDQGRGARGSSAMMPAMDLQVLLEKQGGDGAMTIQKCKDGADGQRYSYRLDVVELDVDGDGDVITSCVAIFELDGAQRGKNARQSPAPTSPVGEALEQLRELIIAGTCVTAQGIQGIPDGVKLVERAAWRAACGRKRLADDEAKPDSERKAFDRALRWLKKEGWVLHHGEHVWLVDER